MKSKNAAKKVMNQIHERTVVIPVKPQELDNTERAQTFKHEL